MNKLIIIGAGGHARVAIEIATLVGYTSIEIVDINYTQQSELIMGFLVVGGLSYLDGLNETEYDLFIAIGDNAERSRIAKQLGQHKEHLVNLIHPSSEISTNASLGKGVLVNTKAIINTLVSIGDYAIINTGAIVDHESSVGDFTHLGPGVSVAGRVQIGECTFVGIGSVIIDKIAVGKNVTVGAGSTIIKDIDDGLSVVGVSKVISK